MELNKIIQGDALEILKTLPTESVDCIITSPPYWALRDYGIPGQLGLEKTFEEYINKLCDIFDEAKRVLKNEGSLWVNIGDTYSTGNKGKGNMGKASYTKPLRITTPPAKSLLQIPAYFSIEMARRGWILRNEIIWHKPNAMPASVKDRFTVDFEKVFFFVKQPKYFFVPQYEPLALSTQKDHRLFDEAFTDIRRERGYPGSMPQQGSGMLKPNAEGRNKRTVWTIGTTPFSEADKAHFATYPEELIRPMIEAGTAGGGAVLDMFMGAGTTAVVAKKLGRKYIGIEINPEYIKMAEKRINQVPNTLWN